MKKFAFCARDPTVDQRPRLESQIRALEDYCEQNRIVNYEFFTVENLSRAKMLRPLLGRMMVAVRNRNFPDLFGDSRRVCFDATPLSRH